MFTIAGVTASPVDDDIIVVEPSPRLAIAVQALLPQAKMGDDRAPSKEGTNKGKASVNKRKAPTDEGRAPTFTVGYGLDTPFGEATVILGLCIKATDQAL